MFNSGEDTGICHLPEASLKELTVIKLTVKRTVGHGGKADRLSRVR